MATLFYVGVSFYAAVLIYCTIKLLSTVISRSKSSKKSLVDQFQCAKISKKYPHKDPFLGLDLFVRNATAAASHTFLESVTKRHDEVGETYQLNMLGTVGIMTRDHEIIKAVLSTRFKDFTIDDKRKKVLNPVLGNGIFSTDGPQWTHSRTLLRPQFARAKLVDLSQLEKHLSRLVDLIPEDQEIDLQDLFLRFTMDVATEFLLGESTDGLLAGRGRQRADLEQFSESIKYVQDKMATHIALGRLAVLQPDPKFKHHVRLVHKFVDGFVDKALREHRAAEEKPQNADSSSSSYVLLQALVQDVQDPKCIRDELINILIAGRDTTASLISNVFFLLSRHPKIWEKLRQDIAQFEGRPPTFEQIPQCRSIRYVINESLRLFPPVPVNSRVAVRDTVIPRGGGPDGKSALFVPKGMPVVYNVYGLHRREDIYGPNADEFQPTRWESLRVGWEFVPFSGGPRICIGQQFAIIEASYVLIRFLQIFATLRCEDAQPWVEKIALTVTSRNGVRVSLSRTT
ncbi:cytochrome P450 [Mariannaea sp. PMI_226]|nr:cytochrome P450 [Mariannaea sp. PMI_226]